VKSAEKIKWAAKEALIRLKYMTVSSCIFCKIANGKQKVKHIIKSGSVIAFDDINPVAKVHILIVPKKHIESVSTLESKNAHDLIEMFKTAAKIAESKKLEAFRLTFNGGKFQHVPHLHMHLLAGSKIDWSKL